MLLPCQPARLTSCSRHILRGTGQKAQPGGTALDTQRRQLEQVSQPLAGWAGHSREGSQIQIPAAEGAGQGRQADGRHWPEAGLQSSSQRQQQRRRRSCTCRVGAARLFASWVLARAQPAQQSLGVPPLPPAYTPALHVAHLHAWHGAALRRPGWAVAHGAAPAGPALVPAHPPRLPLGRCPSGRGTVPAHVPPAGKQMDCKLVLQQHV